MKTKKWEYHEQFESYSMDLSELGSQGWELVTVITHQSNVISNRHTYIFKRELNERSRRSTKRDKE